MKRIFYEKVGRRYKPVAEYDSDLFDSFTRGCHLVVCKPGVKSTRHNITPAYAPLIAATHTMGRTIADLIVDASEMQASQQPITQEQADAWHALARAFGKDMYTLNRPSANDIADAALDELHKEAAKLLSNPAVKEAYDQFITLCELTKEEQ